jgi:hypothetical protein
MLWILQQAWHRAPCDATTQDATCALPESVARCADDVGHLEGGRAHGFISLLERLTSLGLDTSMASSGLGIACRWRRDRCKTRATNPAASRPTQPSRNGDAKVSTEITTQLLSKRNPSRLPHAQTGCFRRQPTSGQGITSASPVTQGEPVAFP